MSEASENTRVGIKAAFPVKKREMNGLNRVAAHMNDNRAERVPVVGYVEFTKHTETVEGDEMTVALVVVEPVVDAQGRSFKGYADDVRRMVEDMRKSAGKPSVAETLFDGGTKKALDDELDGQIDLIERPDDGQVKPTEAEMTAHEQAKHGVPEKSAAELAAERAEGVPAAEQTVTDKPADVVRSEQADVTGGIVRPARKPRGATVRPNTDPFDPKPAA